MPALVNGFRRAAAVALALLGGLIIVPVACANTYSVSDTTDAPATNAASGCATSLPGGACTLRSAVQAANAAGGANTITLAPGDYKMTIAPTDEQSSSISAELEITNDDQLTISSSGNASSTTIDANFLDRAFGIDSDGSSLSLSGVTVENGRSDGLGDVTTCPTTLPSSSADGGAILSYGALTLTNDVITDSMAVGYGGGIAFESNQNPSPTPPPLTVTGTTISDNTTCDDQDLYGTDGGGIYELSSFGATDSISDSTIENNTVPADSGSGGGIAQEGLGDTVDITDSTISNNVASEGAGIFSVPGTEVSSALNLFGDTLSGNSTDSTEVPEVRRPDAPAQPSSDAFGPGGGLYDIDDALSITDSTITANAATDGGGIAWEGLGGFVQGTVSFSTITGNTAVGSPGDDGNSTGNIESVFGSDGTGLTLDDTIVADGSSPSGDPTNCNDGSSLSGGIASDGNNLFDDTSDAGAQCGAVSSDLVKAFSSFDLGSLANNGGPTETEALELGSPAINAANESKCLSETPPAAGQAAVDQRGVTRPQGPACDIGAYEFQEADIAVTSSASPTTIDAGQQTTVTDTITNNGYSNDSAVTFSDPISGSFTIDSVDPSQGACTHTSTTVSCNLGSLDVSATATVKIVLTGNASGTLTLDSSVTGNLPDPVLTNNHASVSVTVLDADLALKKTADPKKIVKGHRTTFTLAVKNRGPATDTDVVLTDKLPSGLKFDSDHASQGKCSGAAKVTCHLGTIASGHTALVKITVSGTKTGKIRNTGHVTGKVKDPNLKNNTASATVIVSAPPCVENLVFTTHYEPSEHVTTVKIYEDGRLTRTLHGSNLRRVEAKPLPRKGLHSVTVMFIISPYETVTATRIYNDCSSGVTHYSYPPQTYPGSS